MRYTDNDRRTLAVDEHIALTGILSDAHDYVVNGCSPLGWLIDRHHIKTGKRNGITNDPNGWFEKPEDLIPAIKRIFHERGDDAHHGEPAMRPSGRLA